MRLLFISLISFIIIAAGSLTFGRQTKISSPPKQEVAGITTNLYEEFVIQPILTDNANFPIVSAQAVLAIDLESQAVLYEKNPDEPFLPASTTKIMTALIAMDYFPDDMQLVVKDPKVEGQKMGLIIGEKIKAQDLLFGLLVSSANDAAEVLAQNYPGGREFFVTMMNLKAKELNLERSNFTNPTGLDNNGDNVYTTARDLIKVATFAMENPRFAEIVGTKQITVKSIDGKFIHKLTNINELLGIVEGVAGVKTGWTENARENLVAYVNRENKRVMIALLGSQDRFGETKELIEWIYANYTWKQIPKPY